MGPGANLFIHDTEPQPDNITDLTSVLPRDAAEHVEEHRKHLACHLLQMRDVLSGILLIDTEGLQELFSVRAGTR